MPRKLKRNSKKRRATKKAIKNNTFHMESLEKRELMAADVDRFGTLQIEGTNANDTVTVSNDRGMIRLYENGTTQYFSPMLVRRIRFNGGNGNDYFANYASQLHVTAMGGNGNDQLHGGGQSDSLHGGDGHDRLYGHGGNDNIFGNDGNDLIHGHEGNDRIYGQDGNDTAYGGSGSDIVSGGYGDDSLHGGSGADRIFGSYGRDELHGDNGNDSLYGQAGDDHLYAGAGQDYLRGGNGNDTLVSIDNDVLDTLYGDAGNDSFWTDRERQSFFFFFHHDRYDLIADATAYELANDTHRVLSFEEGVDKTLDGDDLIDPAPKVGDYYMDFSDKPLFADGGPTQQDIEQGSSADCWMLAALGSIAKANPNIIRQAVVDLGDGTYAVKIKGSYFRVDGELPTDRPGSNDLTHAGLGREDSLWVAIIEKAYAIKSAWQHHDKPNTPRTYAMGGGDSRIVFEDLGLSHTYSNFNDPAQALRHLNRLLGRGDAVTLSTSNSVAAGCPCIGNHWYIVERVNYRNGVPVSVVLRNPHGVDNAGNDGVDDGLVTVTGEQLVASIWGIRSARV